MILGGNRDNAAFSGSRTSNWNNYPWNFNWNIGVRAVCDNRIKTCEHYYGAVHRLPCSQPFLSRFGEYVTRFR